MNRIVVSDTTAITHLAKIDALDILHKLYGEVLIPEAVASELAQVKRTQPGALQVLNSHWIKTVVTMDVQQKPMSNKNPMEKTVQQKPQTACKEPENEHNSCNRYRGRLHQA